MRYGLISGVTTLVTWFPEAAYRVFRVLEKALDNAGI